MELGGVPAVVRPPAGGERADAPVIVAWHLLDAPRNERALAAALPMAALDAWKIYLGLPLSGSRLPAGGPAEIQQRIAEDPVLRLHRPIVQGAFEEFPAALAAARRELGLSGEAPMGLLGGSMGSAVAQLVLAETGVPVRAAVLVSPVTRMRATIDGLSRHFGMEYGWTPPSSAFAERIDFTDRADRLAAVPLRYVIGADDLPEPFLQPLDETVAALERLGGVVDKQVIPGMGHSFYDETAGRPTPAAATIDELAIDWFRKHL
jgi:pimeloyl-ACP methyl ester carboxylesterase